eukprot:tig00000093_g3557.t1
MSAPQAFNDLPSLARVALISLWVFLGVGVVAFAADLTSQPHRVSASDRRTRARFANQKTAREIAGLLLRDSAIGRAWSLCQGALALFSATLFVLNTYHDPDPGSVYLSGGDYFVVHIQPLIELVISFLFFGDYLIQLYLADMRLLYMLQPLAILDFITFAPTIVTWLLLEGTSSLSFVRFLRITRGLTLMKTSVSGSVFALRREDDTRRQMRILVFTVALDNSGRTVAWHDSLYYLFVTMSTVGYGDITPMTSLGRAVAIAILVVAFTAVPMQLNKLLALMQMQTAWSRPAALKRNQPHIIVCGQLNFNAVADFLTEFFHKAGPPAPARPPRPPPTGPDSKEMNAQNRTENAQYKVIFLSSEEPKRETEILSVLVTSALYGKRVQYLVGTPLMYEDLLRTRPERARACFLLANKGAADPDEDDRATFLRCWAFKNLRCTLPLYVQILRSRNERHLRALLDDSRDAFFSVERMKMYLLAKSCLAPGFAALIANLMRSDDLAAYALPEASWKAEYGEGVNDEIYSVAVDKRWWGLSFAALVADVFCTHGLLVIGMAEPVKGAEGAEGAERVEICRFDARVRRGCRLFVLAPDPTTALDLQYHALPRSIALVQRSLASMQVQQRRGVQSLARRGPGGRPLKAGAHAGGRGALAQASASGVVIPEAALSHWILLEQAAAQAARADALERAGVEALELSPPEAGPDPAPDREPSLAPASTPGPLRILSCRSASHGTTRQSSGVLFTPVEETRTGGFDVDLEGGGGAKEEALSPAAPAEAPSRSRSSASGGSGSGSGSPPAGEAAPAGAKAEAEAEDGDPAPLRSPPPEPPGPAGEAARARQRPPRFASFVRAFVPGAARGPEADGGGGTAPGGVTRLPGGGSRRNSTAGDPMAALEDIVLVCGMLEGIHHFVAGLRGGEEGARRPVVMLGTEPLTDDRWFDIADALTHETVAHGTPPEQLRRLCGEHLVFFVQGSPLLLRDLDKAGLDRAAVVVLLSEERVPADREARAGAAGAFDERMVDAATLMTVKLIEDHYALEHARPGPFVIAGLKFASNGAFLTLQGSAAAVAEQLAERAGAVGSPRAGSDTDAGGPDAKPSADRAWGAQGCDGVARAAARRHRWRRHPARGRLGAPRPAAARRRRSAHLRDQILRAPSDGTAARAASAAVARVGFAEPAKGRKGKAGAGEEGRRWGRLGRARGAVRRAAESVLRVLGAGAERAGDEEAALLEREDGALLGDERGEKQQYIRPHFAAGRLYWSSMLDSYLHSAFYNHELFAVVRRIVSPGEDVALRQVPVPPGLAGAPYAELFAQQLALRRLPIALYRSPAPPLGPGQGPGGPPVSANPLPYVYTNPRADAPLFIAARSSADRAVGSPDGAAVCAHVHGAGRGQLSFRAMDLERQQEDVAASAASIGFVLAPADDTTAWKHRFAPEQRARQCVRRSPSQRSPDPPGPKRSCGVRYEVGDTIGALFEEAACGRPPGLQPPPPRSDPHPYTAAASPPAAPSPLDHPQPASAASQPAAAFDAGPGACSAPLVLRSRSDAETKFGEFGRGGGAREARRYAPLKFLGGGVSGTAFLAAYRGPPPLGDGPRELRRVALKRFASGPAREEEHAFERGALEQLRRLRLFMVPTLWDELEPGPGPGPHRLFATTYFDAPSVDEELRRGGAFSAEEVASFLEQMSLLFYRVHGEARLLHCDVSTSNLLVRRFPDRPKLPQFVLIDFANGIRRRDGEGPGPPADLGLPERRESRVHPRIAPTEMMRGREVGAPYDFFFVGCVALQMLTGIDARHDDYARLDALFAQAMSVPAAGDLRITRIERSLRTVLARLIQPYPELRLKSAVELWSELREHGWTPTLAGRDFVDEEDPFGVRVQVQAIRAALAAAGAKASSSPGPASPALAPSFLLQGAPSAASVSSSITAAGAVTRASSVASPSPSSSSSSEEEDEQAAGGTGVHVRAVLHTPFERTDEYQVVELARAIAGPEALGSRVPFPEPRVSRGSTVVEFRLPRAAAALLAARCASDGAVLAGLRECGFTELAVQGHRPVRVQSKPEASEAALPLVYWGPAFVPAGFGEGPRGAPPGSDLLALMQVASPDREPAKQPPPHAAAPAAPAQPPE